MHRMVTGVAVVVLVWVVVVSAPVAAQAPAQITPRLMKFTGVVTGGPGVADITVAFYAEQASETPLWSETRRIVVDENGRYAVYLGASRPEGLPVDLFASGEAKWLGVQVAGQNEQPRVLLVSVPYALKAADAETIGGKPLSAFVLAGDRTGVGSDGLTYVNTQALKAGLSGAGPLPQGAGSPGYIGVFTDSVNLGNSVLFQSGTSIGVGTTTPAAPFHVAATSAPSAFFDVYSNSLGALPTVYRAARGTPAAPSAVQADDILGGLAVRGYMATGFSAGRGQVMFKAAENWTDTANGTYLQFTTTPTGAASFAERMRITSAGNVGIGTTTPAQMLSVAGVIESTSGGFRFPNGTTQTTAAGAIGGPTSYNTASGWDALRSITTGRNNTATGAYVLSANTTGYANTASGSVALNSNTTGSFNTASGMMALYSNTTGYANTAAGYEALGATQTGYSNSAFGYRSLYSNSGNYNTALGVEAGRNNIFGEWNTFIGYQAGQSSTYDLMYATAVGASAVVSQSNTLALGGPSGTPGAVKVGIGTSAPAQTLSVVGTIESTAGGFKFPDGTTQTRASGAIGAPTSFNTATGTGALGSVIAAETNTAIGHDALGANTDGDGNMASGYGALRLTTRGAYNSASGAVALYSNTLGNGNTASGAWAGYYNVDGSNNTFVGRDAGPDSGHGSLWYATALGAGALVTQSNTLVLGGDRGTAGAVKVGIGTSAPVSTLQVTGDIRVGTAMANGCLQNFNSSSTWGSCSSDVRLKKDIRPFAPMLDRVAQLRPVHFTWRADEFPDRHFGNAVNSGLVAQEVETVFPELVSTDEQGFKMVNNAELPYLTLQAVKELKAENDALRMRADKKDEQIRRLTEQVGALTRAVAALSGRKQ